MTDSFSTDTSCFAWFSFWPSDLIIWSRLSSCVVAWRISSCKSIVLSAVVLLPIPRPIVPRYCMALFYALIRSSSWLECLRCSTISFRSDSHLCCSDSDLILRVALFSKRSFFSISKSSFSYSMTSIPIDLSIRISSCTGSS